MMGQHIRTRRGGRWSHAIDCGDETVIHLAEDAGAAGRIRRSYRPEFVSGADVVEAVPHREGKLPPEEVVARAYSLLGDPALAATFPDSAAFATWCATGRSAPAAERERASPAPAPRTAKTGRAGAASAARAKPPRQRAAPKAQAKGRGKGGREAPAAAPAGLAKARARKAPGRGARGR